MALSQDIADTMALMSVTDRTTRCTETKRASRGLWVSIRASRVVVLLTLVSLLASCARTQDAGGPDTSSDSSWSLSVEDSIALAEDDKHVAPPEQFQIAQTLRITEAGPVPSTLVVIRDRELMIRNETSSSQTLVFVNADVDSNGGRTLGPIEPGGEMIYVPGVPISMAYTIDGEGVDGTLQVDTGEFEG